MMKHILKEKTEEESKHLTLELCEKVVEFLPGELKKFQGELPQPDETDECLPKAETMEVDSNIGVETAKIVSEGNLEVSKGESFLISPEISKVAYETCGMSEHVEVDDTPFKAEKIPEDEEKMANNKKFQLDKEAGIEENVAKEATDENVDKIESDKQALGIQEASLELGKQALIDTHDPAIDSSKKANEMVTEVSNSNLVQEELEEKSFKEVKDTEPEKLPALVGKEEGTEATELIEISVSEKDQIVSDSIGETLKSTVAESSEIKDHETTSEIIEVKELCNPNEEVARMQEPAPEVDEKIEEVSSIIIEDKSQVTIESTEEVKDITGETDGIEDKNVLDASSAMKTEELCLQEVENIKTETTIEESPTEEGGQSEIIDKDYANSESENIGVEVKVEQATDQEPIMTEASDEMKMDEEPTVPMIEGNISEVDNIDDVQHSQEGKPENEEIMKESFQREYESEKKKPSCALNAVDEDANTAISSETAETSTGIKEVTSVKDQEERFNGKGMEDTPKNTDAVSKDAESEEKDHHIEVNENTEILGVPNKDVDQLHVADSLVGQSVEKGEEKQYELSDFQPEEQVHEANVASKEKEEDSDDVSAALQSINITNSEYILTEAAAAAATTTDLKSETSEIDKENARDVYLVDPEKCSEKPEPVNAMKVEDNSKQEETKEVCEGPESVIKEECDIIDESMKSNEEEMNESFQEKEKEKEGAPEVEVCEKLEISTVADAEKQILEEEGINTDQTSLLAETMEEKSKEENTGAIMSIKEACKESETASSRTGKENPEMQEHPIADLSNSYISDETVKESIEEDESSSTNLVEASNSNVEETDTTEQSTHQNLEETTEPNNDPSLLGIEKDSKEEITALESKEDPVCSSSFELEVSKKESEEETLVEGSITTADSGCASPDAEMEEIKMKEAELEEEKKDINNVLAFEDSSLATTEHEGVSVDSADIDVKPVDSSTLCEKVKETPQEDDQMQDKGHADQSIEELNLDTGEEKRVEVKEIADQDSSLEEKCGSIEETSHSQEAEHEGTKTYENADNMDSDKPVLGIEEANVELKKQAVIGTPDPTIDSLEEANETVTEASNSNLVLEELEEKSLKEVRDIEPEKLPALVAKEEDTTATEHIEISGSEKDQIISDSIGDTSTSALAETSEIKDHETTSETSEVSKKELCKTYEEVVRVHEPVPEVHEKLEEVSSIIIEDKSQATIESTKEIKDMTGENDGIQDKNVLDASSVMKADELCLQEVDNIASDIRTETDIEESPTEESEQSEINDKTEQHLGTSTDKCKDCANSESEVEAEIVQTTDKELSITEASDKMKRNEEPTVPTPEADISEVENIDVVQQSQKGKPENEEILKESFQQENEPEKEKPSCPLNTVDEEANTAISIENAGTSTVIKEATSIKDKEERLEGEGMEDTPMNTDAVSRDAESEEKDQQTEVNENTETLEVEIANKNADDLHVADSLLGQSVSNFQPEEQVHEANGAYKEEEEKSNDVSEVLESTSSTNSHHIVTEATAASDLKSETSEVNKESVKDVYLLDCETCSQRNEALENKQEGTQKELEDRTAEKPEPKDAKEDTEDNLKQEESKEVCEGPESITKEECAITIDESMKSNKEEMQETFQEDEKQEIPEEEVCENLEINVVQDADKQFLEEEETKEDKTTLLTETMEEKPKEENTGAIMSIEEVRKESETAASGTGKENSEMEEHPIADISNSSISDETVKEGIKEDESSSLKLVEEASESNIEEKNSTEQTTEPNNDPSLLDIDKDSKKEITELEAKEDAVRASLFELESSKKDTEEETSVKETISAADLGSASPAAEMEETNIKEAEPEEKKEEINDVLVVEENGLATTGHEGIGVNSVNIDVKEVDSTSCEKMKGIPQEEDVMQDKVPNTGSEDQMETATMETLGDAVKEYSNMPSEEYEPTTMEEGKITDETSEKDHAPDEHSETPVSQATTDEISIQKEDNATLDVPAAEPEDTEKESGQEVKEHFAEEPYVHTKQESGKCSFVSEVINVSNGEEPRELENESDACKAKTLPDEKSSGISLEREKVEDGKPLDEASDVGETLGTSIDRENAIQEEENLAKNLAKPESLKEDTELPREAHDQIPEVINVNDNAKNVGQTLADFEEKPEFNSETVVEDQSMDTFSEASKSLADETSTDVQNQETEKQILEELEDNVDKEDDVNKEQNENEVTKAVILSEEVDKEVEKADGSEDIKEHVIEEESSTSEPHLEAKGDETTNKVEDTSVSTECLKEADSSEQIETRESEVEEHTKDQTILLTETMEDNSKEENTSEIEQASRLTYLETSSLFYTTELALPSTDILHKQTLLSHTCTQCEASKPESDKETNKIEDDSKAANNFEVSTLATDKEDSLEKENEKREPEKEASEESETAASGTGKENSEMEEHSIADITDSTEQTTEPNNDPGLLDIEKDSKEEITELEAKEDTVRTSSFELKESKKESEEETSVKQTVNTADLGSASPAAEMEETNLEEAEPEEKKEEINDVLAVEENGLATTGHEGIGVNSVDIDVKEVDSSTSCEKMKGIPQEEDVMQDKVPNTGSEDQMETATMETLGDAVKEYSNMPSEEYEPTTMVEGKITDETSEKDHAPDEHSETPVSQATTDEISIQKEDNPTLDVPAAEPEDTEKESGQEVKEHFAEEPYAHTEQESGKCSFVSEVINVSNGEEPRELENESDACKAKKLQDEKSSGISLEREKVEDGKPLDEASDVGESSGTSIDRENAIQEEENLDKNSAKPESLKEDTELPREAHDQIPEVINVNDNAKNLGQTLADFEEKPEYDPETVVEDQSKETFSDASKSLAEETSPDVQNQETEKQILEELEDNVDKEDLFNKEPNENEVTKAVILSEEVDKDVEKADGSEDIKQHVTEEESSTNEPHLEAKGDETTNEVEDTSVSTECLKEADSSEQIETRESEVEEHTKDQTMLLTETMEDNSKEENTSEIEQKIEDDSKAANNFEVSTLATDKEDSLEKENEKREPEKEASEESETTASGTGKENSEMEEHPIADISNSSISDETVKAGVKEDKSSSLKLVEEASDSNIEEKDSTEQTTEPNNDPSLLDIEKDSKEEITELEAKEDTVRTSSFELKESKKDTEEETSVKQTVNTADLGSASPAAEMEETNLEEAEPEEKKEEINDVLAVEENGLTTTGHEGIGVNSVDIDVKEVDDSTLCEEVKGIPQEEDTMQDKVPNAGSEDQMVTATMETLGDAVKEYSNMLSEEYEPTTMEGKITDETSEKDHAPDKHSETPVSQATTDEIPIQKEDNPTLDVPAAEPEDTEKESGQEVKEHFAEEPYAHTEQESGKCSFVSEVINVSNGEEPRELENESDACKEKTMQDEKSSGISLEREKVEDGKPLDEASDVGESSGTSIDRENAIQEEENLAKNLAKPESLKEDTELPREAHDQIPEVINVNDNAKNLGQTQVDFEEKPEYDSETVVEDQSKETFSDASKSLADETSTDVQNQETEKHILEQREYNVDKEDHVNKEPNENEVTKAVILSEEVDKEVEKADGSEDIKEHVTEEESSTNEPHLEAKGDETTNEVEDTSVSTECLKEADSSEQIETRESEVEEHTKDQTILLTETMEDNSKEENTSEIEQMSEESETAASAAGKENSEMEEHPIADICNSSISDETVKAGIKEDESSSLELVEEASDSNIEEKDSTEQTTDPNNDPSLLDIEKDSKEEITELEAKEDTVRTSSFELKESKKDTEEETSVKQTVNTADLGSASPAAEMEETNLEEAEPEEKKEEINDFLAVEENGLATTGHEGIGVNSVDIDLKEVDSSTSCEKMKGIPQEEDVMQDKVPNTGSEDQMETVTMETLGHAVKEYSNMPSEEYEPTTMEEGKITDETSEKDHAPDKHSETPVSQATTDEIPIQKEDNPTLDVPAAEPDDTEEKSGQEVKEHFAEEPYAHTEQESGKCSFVSEVINVSNGEEPRELENESDACKAKKLQDEKSSGISLEREKVEDGKPLDEASDVGESSGTSIDRENAIQEEENLDKNSAKPESLKEDTELPREAHDQIPEVINVNDNAKNLGQTLADFEEKPEYDPETVVEDQSKETFSDASKSLADETSPDVQNQETEKHILEELEDNVDKEDLFNKEPNENEVTKAVILSEEVNKEVEKADGSEDIKEHVTEEESSTNEPHLEAKGDETPNKVEDTAVSTECLKEADSSEQIETRESEVEEHTKDQTMLLTETMEDNSKEENTSEIEQKIEDDSKAANNCEVSTLATDKEDSLEKEKEKREPEKELSEESETAASGTGKDNPETEEYPIADISNPSISDEIVNESIKEDESSPVKLIQEACNSNIEGTDSTEETTLKKLEETEEPNNDPSLLDIEKESKEEITALEAKEDVVSSSSFELEESRKDTEEETSMKGTIDTADLGSASLAVETEEINVKEAEPEEKKDISNVLADDENSLGTTEHEGVIVANADIDVKPVDSTLCKKVKEIPQEEDGMQDKKPKTGSEDQIEMATREIPFEEVLGDADKECTNMPADEPTPMEERKITDETSEKDHAPDEHSEIPVPQATDEILIQEDNSTLDAPERESEAAEKGSGHEVEENLAKEPYGHTEQESGKSSSVSEVINVSNVEEPGELENESDACKAKALQDELISDIGLEREKVEDGKPLDEVTEARETSYTYKDREKEIQEEENLAKSLAKSESLKEDTEVEKEDTELPRQAEDQIPEVTDVNDDAKDVELAQPGFVEKLISDSETLVEDRSMETVPEAGKGLVDETSTDVQNQEVEKQLTEEPEDKMDNEDHVNREENANEITKAVILSEEADKEVERADDSEDIKEHEEENISTVEKIDEEKLNEAEIPGDSSDVKKTAAIFLEKKIQELEDSKNDETAAAQAMQVEEPNEQSFTSAMHSENMEHGIKANEEEEEVKEVEMLENERFLKPEVVVDQETTVAKVSITEETVEIEPIGTIEMLDEEKRKEAENLEDEICEHSSARETEDICLQKEEPNQLNAVPKEGITSGQTFIEEKSDEQFQISTSGITGEELEHDIEKTEDEETNKEEAMQDEISEDASDARKMEEICSQKERSIELDAVVEDEMTAGDTLTEMKSEELVQNPTSTLPSKEVEGGNTSITEEGDSEKLEEAEFLQEDIREDVSLQKEQLQETDLTEETTLQSLEETAEPNNDSSLLDVVNESKEEITTIEAKEVLVNTSSFELEESKKDTEEETSVKESINTADLDSALTAVETEETNMKAAEAEPEAEEKQKEIDNILAVEESELATNEHEEISVDSTDIDVKPADSFTSCKKEEIPQKEDGMQVKVLNAGSEHQIEMSTGEIPIKEKSGDEVECSTRPAEEYEPTAIEERKITDETSDKDQAPDEHSETPVSQAGDEILMQKEDNPMLDVPKAESEDGKECGEQPSDIGVLREKVEDGKPLDKAMDVEEASGISNDSKKAIQEEEILAENLPKPEGLEEDTEVEREETELPRGTHDEIPEVTNVDDNAKTVEIALAGFEKDPRTDSEAVIEDQNKETFTECSKSQVDETSTDVQNQETEKQVTKELEDEDHVNGEQTANEVTKAVILSKEVNKEVEKVDDSEEIKERVIEEESSGNDFHLEPKEDETTNEVEEYTSVSTECLEEVNSNKQIEARKSDVEELSTNDREASLIIKESEERRLDEKSADSVSVQGADKESAEKIENIVDESKLCQETSNTEAATKVETSLNDMEIDKELVNPSNISSETAESDGNQETKELQLEEVSADLAPPIPTNDNDEVEKQSLELEIIDKDEAEVINRDSGEVYLPKDQIDEAERSLTVEKVDQLPNNNHELVETMTEASKTSNADELGEIELALEGDNVSEHKDIEQEAETNKSLTGEELEANEVEETKGVPETSSNHLSQRVETVVDDNISSLNTLPKKKSEEQLQTSASTLPSKDEDVKTPNSVEEIVKEIQEDAEDETDVEQGLQKEEAEKQIQTTSSKDATGAVSEELDVVTGDGITGEQTLSAYKPDKGTTSKVQKIDEEKINEAEIPENKSLGDSSDAKKTAEICSEKDDSEELEDAKKDETAAAQTIQVEEPKEQCSTPALPSENVKHGTTASEEEEEEEEVKGVEILEKEIRLEKERPQEPEAVEDQETTAAQASISEESVEIEAVGTGEKLDEEEIKEAENLEKEIRKDSSAREIDDICLQKEEPSELNTVPREGISSGQTLLGEKSDEQFQISTSGTTCEELEHETRKTEDEETTKDEIPEDASDARTTEEICSEKERFIEQEAIVEDEITAGHTLTEKKSEEQVENPTSALLSKEEECGNATEKIESEKIVEAEFLQDDDREDVSVQKEQLEEDKAKAKDENVSSQTLPAEKSEEKIPNPVPTLPSEEHKHESISEVDETEEEKVKEEMENEDSDGVKTVAEICSEKDETREAQAVLEGETVDSQVIAQEETQEDDKSQQSECVREIECALEDGATAAQTLSGDSQPDELHTRTSTLPSKEQQDETKETELQEDESPEKTPEQTREIEEASNVKTETHEMAFNNKLVTESEDAEIKEKLVKAIDETAVEGNEIKLEEVSKEEDKEVTETSHTTSHSEELTKDSSVEEELKDKLIEDKTNEALETICQNQELLVESQKSTENDIIEKQIVFEDKTVEDPGQASVARIEITTVTEEESSIELSQAEGRQIIDDIQQPEIRSNTASDKQIPREIDPIKNTEITSSINKEPAPIDLQDSIADSSQKTEVGDVKEIYPKEAEVDHSGEKVTDSGEDLTKEFTSVEDSTKVSSDDIESSKTETLQVTREDRAAKDGIGAAKILLVENPEERSPAPSSKLPSEEGEQEVSTQADEAKEKEPKEVEVLAKDSSDTKTEEHICLEKEENKELKAAVEQETNAAQALPTEIKEDPVSHFEDGCKEDELKDEYTGDKTNETLGVPTYELQKKELSLETLKDGANNNIEKETVAEDETVMDLEQAPVAMKEDVIVREEESSIELYQAEGAKDLAEGNQITDDINPPEIRTNIASDKQIPREVDPIENVELTSSIAKEHVPIDLQGGIAESSQKAEVGNVKEIYPKEAEVEDITKESSLVEDSTKVSSSDNVKSSTKETLQVTQEEREAKDEASGAQYLLGERQEEEKSPAPSSELPSDKGEHEVSTQVNAVEEKELKDMEILDKDSSDTKTREEICLKEEENKELKAVLEHESIAVQTSPTQTEEDPVSHFEDGCKEDEHIGDKTKESLKVPTYELKTEELSVDTLMDDPNNNNEKEIVAEDETVKDLEQAPDATEEIIVREEIPGEADLNKSRTRSSIGKECFPTEQHDRALELSQAEGNKDLAEGNQIIDDIQQPELRTNIASDKQIPREIYPVEETEITSSISKEHAPIDLQEGVEESSQKAEVGCVKEIYPKEAEVDHSGEKIKDNSSGDIIKESVSVEDSTKVSSIDDVESSTKETLRATPEEREEKDKTDTVKVVLVEQPEKEPEHEVSTQVDAVKEKEPKEVEILDKDTSDTKTGEAIAVEAPPTEIKEGQVSHVEDGHKEDELKEEHTGEKTNEILNVPTYEIQKKEHSLETLKDGANNNIEKEIVAEDVTVKDLEQAPFGMKEATIVGEENPGEADPIESRKTSSIGKDHFPIEQQDTAFETSDKAELGDLEPGSAQEICSEAVVDHGEEKKTDKSGVGIIQKPASPSDLLQRSPREKMLVSEHVIEEKELTVSKEEPQVDEADTIQDNEAKTDEEKDGEERDDHSKTDSGLDAPVMVEAPRDTDTKPHKKSHNILSGVGSKVKHSISKVKKAITGKYSHSKESKSQKQSKSPKGSEK
ncbi:hypothetical protein PTKIN_Ptkin07bG0027300 [Pterospermum kingtungense]